MDFNEVFDNHSFLVFVKNESFEFVYANKALKAFLGLDPEFDLIGKTDFDIFDESVAVKHRGDDEAALNGGRTIELEPQKLILSNGAVCLYKTTKHCHIDKNGKKYVVGITTEVTNSQNQKESFDLLQIFESVVHRITRNLAKETEIDKLVWSFVHHAFKELRLDDLVLYLSDNSSKTLRQVAAYGDGKSNGEKVLNAKVLTFNTGIVGRCARTKQTQNIPELSLDTDYLVDDAVRKSELAVPLLINNELVGVLDSESYQNDFYSPFIQEVFETAANLLANRIDQIRATENLKQTQKYLNEILNGVSGLIVFSLDKNYCYKTFNKAHFSTMKHIWGQEIEVGKSMLNYISKDEDKNKAKSNFDKVLMGEELHIIEEYGEEEMQRDYWQNQYTPQYNEHGEIEGLTVFVRNISREIKYQEELNRSQSLLASINANVKEAIFRLDEDLNIVYCNRGMASLFGLKMAEIDGLGVENLLIDIADKKLFASAKENNVLVNEEIKWLKADGTEFWGLLSSKKILSENETFFDSTIIDISEIKEVRNSLEKKVSELEKLNKELDHLVYRASHDLRAPVASMLGLVELLKIDKDFDPNKFLSILSGQLDRLDEILKNIIDYRKVAITGSVPSKIGLRDMIDTVMKDNDFVHGNARIGKEVEILNPTNEDVVVDVYSLEIVLNNLISNAFKYSDLKKEFPRISVLAKIDAKQVKINVKDNGIGIPKRHHDKVFEMFHRATLKSNGSGLGLFILNEAIQKLGGAVSFTSKLMIGSTFVVEIPNHVQVALD